MPPFELPFRQIHLDFHTSEHIPGVGSKFSKENWQQALKLDPGHAMARLATITIMWQAENRDYAAILASLREGHLSNPADNDIKNSLAWILATCPDEQYRNPEQALEIAQNASRGVNHLNPQFLDTLAAACAANGRFEEAQQHIEQAINLIEAGGQADEETITNFRERQNLYKQNQPYVDK